MPYCPECGMPIEEGKKYCLNCGYDLINRKPKHKLETSPQREFPTSTTKKKGGSVFPLVIMILIIVVGGVVILNLNRFNEDTSHSGHGDDDSNTPFVPQKYVELDVYISSIDGDWVQDENDDIHYTGMVSYRVHNRGNMDATVAVEIYRQGESSPRITESFEIPEDSYITASANFDYTGTSIYYPYSIFAECDSDEDQYSFVIDTEFPRYMPKEYSTYYITVQKQELYDFKEQITTNPITPDWMEIRSWVGSNIEYTKDEIQFGAEDYWQFPIETLEKREGDCEDVAILLCTLLRLDGWDRDDVFVITGLTAEGEGHAWVLLKITEVGGREVWISLEPTAGGWLQSTLVDIISTYDVLSEKSTAWFFFNDYEVVDEIS